MEIVKREKEREKSRKWGSLTRAILFSQLVWYLQLWWTKIREQWYSCIAEYSATRRMLALRDEATALKQELQEDLWSYSAMKECASLTNRPIRFVSSAVAQAIRPIAL